ncbi:CobW/HypB/UreG, nucleotide-binding domain [Dillenia turbinata]|uniref:CobW/HypB/UreG, nucleotide-binding domain n=1 Tax=Dillenia turbinata TaxID=194707 RepID=A0AAN8WA30_9MAGN
MNAPIIGWYYDLRMLLPDIGNIVLLDHILIETTGPAYPAPLASVLWLDDQLESTVSLDSIVTMDNALIDDQRIHVDFSQSVAKLWSQYRHKDNQNGKGNVITDIEPCGSF